MPARTPSGSYSFGDFLELIREDQKADLIDGVIYYTSSPEGLEHDEIALWLTMLLRLYVRTRQLGRVTVNRIAYRLTENTGPEPDVAFVQQERAEILKDGYVDGPPDLAIEVVSPDSVDRDYEQKRAKYEAAGVREYWIIDPDEQKALFLVRGPSGFVQAALDEHIFRSRVIPGFDLDTRWLWQNPLPDERSIVESMLEAAKR